MTTPMERTRTLVQSGAFLLELSRDKSIPEETRVEAHRLIRHFPTIEQVQTMAAVERPTGFQSAMLDTTMDPTWTAHYKYGPLRY